MPPTTVLTVPGFQVWGTVTFGLSYQELRKDGFTESCYLILLQILTFFFYIFSEHFRASLCIYQFAKETLPHK